jgi:hypothetical protein
VLTGIDFFTGAAKVAGPVVSGGTIGRFGEPEGGPLSARTGVPGEQKGIGDFSGRNDSIEFCQGCGKIV